MRRDEPKPAPHPASGSAERLDRLWNATRPAAPTPELLDALWARASVEIDQITAGRRPSTPGADRLVMPLSLRTTNRRRLALGVGLAQAAAVLLAVGFVASRRGAEVPRPVEIAQAPPAKELAAKPMVVVEFDHTLVIRIDDAGPRVVMLDQAPMFPTMAENTQHDLFNALEDAATP